MNIRQTSPSETSWRNEVDELEARKANARRMGGAEGIARQHRNGKLTVRQRIERILDANSFAEIGTLAGKGNYDQHGRLVDFTPASTLIGRGKIDGRHVVVYGDDFTIRGGSADGAVQSKAKLADELAAEIRTPIVRLLDGAGGSVKSIEKQGYASLPGGVGHASGLHLCALNMGRIPCVSLGLGPMAGIAAARMSASHYSVMVKETASMYAGGPPLVERITKKKVTKQELGGWKVQVLGGNVDDAVDTEDEAFERARRFLSYLPSSVWDLPPRIENWDDPERRDEKLLSIVPRDRKKGYLMRTIIESVVDHGSFFEIAKRYGRAAITGLARLDGWPVGILAGDPLFNGGAWDAAAARKIAKFVDTCQTFHLPVVHLVDCMGFAIGIEAESSGTMRAAVQAVSAVHQSTVPWCAIIIRNAFGVGGGAHAPKTHIPIRYAWPSTNSGSLPLEGGVEAAYRAELEASGDRVAKLAEIEARLESIRSPLRTAEHFVIEEIIDPRNTRPLLCEFANIAAPLRSAGPYNHAMRP